MRTKYIPQSPHQHCQLHYKNRTLMINADLHNTYEKMSSSTHQNNNRVVWDSWPQAHFFRHSSSFLFLWSVNISILNFCVLAKQWYNESPIYEYLLPPWATNICQKLRHWCISSQFTIVDIYFNDKDNSHIQDGILYKYHQTIFFLIQKKYQRVCQ